MARLAGFAAKNWPEVDGMLQMESNIDLLDMPVDRGMNVLYTMVMRNRDEKERAKVNGELNLPMKGEFIPEDDPVWGAESQGDSFLAALAAKTADDAVVEGDD